MLSHIYLLMSSESDETPRLIYKMSQVFKWILFQAALNVWLWRVKGDQWLSYNILMLINNQSKSLCIFQNLQVLFPQSSVHFKRGQKTKVHDSFRQSDRLINISSDLHWDQSSTIFICDHHKCTQKNPLIYLSLKKRAVSSYHSVSS